MNYKKNTLLESKESRVQDKIKKMFNNMFPDGLRAMLGGNVQDITAGSFSDYIRLQYRGNAFNKFGAKIAEWYLTDELSEEPQHRAKLDNFRTALSYLITGGHIQEYDANFNNLSPDQLIDRFLAKAQQKKSEEKDALAEIDFEENEDYDIVPILSKEDAMPYNQYNTWCINFQDERNMYDNYAKNTGMFYFLLKKGFDKLPKQRDDRNYPEGDPFDEYGLSMIAVRVDGTGNLLGATSRHNHNINTSKYERADNVYDEKFLSELIGKNFYEVFTPRFDSDELEAETIRTGIKKMTFPSSAILLHDETYYLVNTETNKFIKDERGYTITFTSLPAKLADNLIRVSNVVNNRRFYGVIDALGKTMIPTEYLLIDKSSNNTLRLIALKPGTTDRCTQKLVPIDELERYTA